MRKSFLILASIFLFVLVGFFNKVLVSGQTVTVGKKHWQETNEDSQVTINLSGLMDLSNLNNKVKIGVIGSSVTKGSGASSSDFNWPTRLHYKLNHILQPTSLNVELVNYGFSGFKAQDLIEKKKVAAFIREQPNFIIFETSIINNFRQSTSMEDTLHYIDQLLLTLRAKLPNAKIIVISPNPILTPGKNRAGYFYKDYVQQTGEFIKNQGYDYVNIYDEIHEYLLRNNLQLSAILADEIHPNDEGYRIWFEVLFTQLEKILS